MFSCSLRIFLVVFAFPYLVDAQSVSISYPTAPITVAEGDDFATEVLQNPWDFNQAWDIGWYESFSRSGISVSGGVWTGVQSAAGAYVFPLFSGFQNSFIGEPLPGDNALPKQGMSYPIDASKYSLLSFKMKTSSPSSYAVMWNAGTGNYWPDGTQMGASYDGIYHSSRAYPMPANRDRLYVFDMSNLKSSFEQVSGRWGGSVVALRIDPTFMAEAGTSVAFDWVRLADPSTSKNFTLKWQTSGLPESRVVKLYYDNDNRGKDGVLFKWFSDESDPGEYSLNTAMFPPGEYYFYIVIEYGSGLTKKVESNYSPLLAVNGRPGGYFSSPSAVSGDDYATTEVGNPWDMSDSADVANLPGSEWPDEWRQFSSHSFNNGLFQAVANAPIAPALETDVQVHLNVNPNRPIDTSKYRYLTYRMAVDPTNFKDIHDEVKNGWVSRIVYWNLALFGDGGHPHAQSLYEGYNTYTLDMWKEGSTESGLAWGGNKHLAHLRIDPLETSIPTWFFLDWVKLTAENRENNGAYTISWDLSDVEGRALSFSLYYDTDDQGFDGTLIKTFESISAGAGSHVWDMSGLPDASSYYVYGVVSDQYSTKRFYSTTPVATGSYTPPAASQKVPYDYDGDFRSDPVIYRPDAGGLYYILQSTVGVSVVSWGTSGYKPVSGDFDGDKKEDYNVVVESGGYLYWAIRRSSDGALYYALWGITGDRLVPADYNGDGRSDVAVYRPSTGTWFVFMDNGTVKVQPWGLAEDIPVPGDFDGDSIADFAIWRPSTGEWWVLNSSIPIGGAGYFSVTQWGLPGDIPMIGDYDNDGKTDRTVWRSSIGYWFVLNSSNNAIEMTQWGLPGDVPRVGDFDGDGKLDFTVYRPDWGMWFHNHRKDGKWSYVQWGLPGDALP